MKWNLYLKWITALFAFWLIWFSLLRLFFLGIGLSSAYNLSSIDFVKSLMYGFYMDSSMTAYLLIIPYLLFFVSSIIPFNKFVYFYHLLLFVVLSILFAADVPLYNEWGYRLDYNAFVYLKNAKEASHFISIKNSLLSLFLFVIYISIAYFLYKRIIPSQTIKINLRICLAHLITLGLLIIPLRGGIGIIPMNPGKVFFSTNPVANHAALNVPWNLLYSLDKERKQKPFEAFMPDELAEKMVDSLFSEKNENSIKILMTKRPRIVLFLLESFTSDLIFNKHENEEITPNLNKRFQKGVFFNASYATGDRTEKGIASALSGFPSIAQGSILNYPEKTGKLNSIIRDLKKLNYSNSFYYGGDVSFASMNTYFLNSGCDQLIDKSQFDSELYNAKWGVHDHIIFERLYNDLVKDTSLYFKICLSLSSHPPYDLPEPEHWNSTDEATSFINTAYYTDEHLGILLDKLESNPIWNELLVIIMADHGARWPGNNAYHMPAKFRIPMWMGGGAVSLDSTVYAIASQNDLPATLLYQMDIPNEHYRFSQNLFSSTRQEFAYYAFNNGFGWINKDGIWVYSNDTRQCMYLKDLNCEDQSVAKAYFQSLMAFFKSI